MIQRIQSVYLLLAVVALAVLLLTGLVHNSGGLTQWGTLIFGVPAVAGAGGAIFMFKDRERQRRLIVVTQLCTVLAIVALYGSLFLQGALYVRTQAGIDTARLAVMLLPLLAYLLLILARRSVTRDIRLVESMDRIR